LFERAVPASDDLPVPFEAMLDERLVLSLFALPTDEIKAALAELIIIRLHGVLLRRAQPRKLTRLLVLDEAWRVASSTHLETSHARAAPSGWHRHRHAISWRPAARSFRRARTPDLPKEPAAGSQKAVVRALRRQFRPEAANLHGILERSHPVRGPDPEPAVPAYTQFKLPALLRACGAADERQLDH
jgi:hypothetical protein